MISSEKKIAGVTSLGRLDQQRWRSAPGRRARASCGGLDHHDLRVDGRADGDGDAAQAHDRRRDVEQHHRDERQRHADRERQDRQQRAAEVEQEQHDHEADDDRLLGEGVFQGVDRSLDEPRTVIGDGHLHARGEAGLELGEFLLHALDDVEGVLPVAHDHDAADGLAFAVPLEQAAPDVGAEAHRREVLDQQRRPVRPVGAHRDLLDRSEVLDVAAPAHVVLAPRELEDAAPHVVVRLPDGVDDLRQRDAVGAQAAGIDGDLVLLLVAAHAGHLGDARHAAQRVAQREVLERPQVVEPVRAGLVGQRVLEHPADAGRVRPERRRRALGQRPAQAVHVLEHAAARPVDVRALLEDRVDERHPEHREAAHVGDVRRPDQLRDDRVGDLVLDQGRAAAHPLGEDDDLRIGEVRDRVQPRLLDGDDRPTRAKPTPSRTSSRLRAQNSMIFSTMGGPSAPGFRDRVLAVVHHRPHAAVLDLAGAAGVRLVRVLLCVEIGIAAGERLGAAPSPPGEVWPSMAARRRLSESIRKFPVVTTVSPSLTPLRISTRSLRRAPTFTIRGSKWPPSFATKR